MYVGYLFNVGGRYQAPVYLEQETEVLAFAFRYKAIAPKIMATLRDESVLEVENGAIVFPELEKEAIFELERTVAPMSPTATIEELLASYQERVDLYMDSKGKDSATYQSMVQIETDMFALAARDGVIWLSLDGKILG